MFNTEATEAEVFYTAGDVAHEARKSSEAVREWDRRGILVPDARTPNGVRLYRPDNVRRFLDGRRPAHGE